MLPSKHAWGAMAVAALFSSHALAAVTFSILTPTAPTYDSLQINGVSGDGKFVIGQMSNNNLFRATRWTADDSIHLDLGLVSPRPYSQGEYLSFNGSIAAANAIDSSFNSQMFQWTSPSTRITLPFIGTGTYLYSAGISSDGSVLAGYGNTTNVVSPPSPQRMVRWTSAGGLVTVPLPAGIPSTIASPPDQQATRSLSGNGNFIIGQTINGSPNVGYRYDNSTGISTDIGHMQGTNLPHLTSISNDGSVILGFSSFEFPDFTDGQVGFLWTQAGGFKDIGRLGGEGDFLIPRFLSGDGKVILGTDSGTNFIWTQQTGIMSFSAYLAGLGVDTLGMTSLIFAGISDDGATIVGTGTTSSGLHRGWILTTASVPEPATLTTAILATTTLLLRRRKPQS